MSRRHLKYRPIHEIRRLNLESLISSFSCPTEFSLFIGKHKGYISQYINSKSPVNIGSRLAREVESKLSKPYGWLDADHDREIAIIKNVVDALKEKGVDDAFVREVLHKSL